MRKTVVLKRFTAVGAAAMAVIAASAPPVLAATSPDYTTVDSYVNSQMQDAHIPGVALGIVHGDQVVHVEGFGQADPSGRPVTPQTPFFIGSLSKSFTALAVMQLVDSGEVDLDRPVQAYLPDFRVADADASRRITVRELLNQTSGIPTSAGISPLTGPVTSLADQVAALRQVALTSDPGRRFQYSNSNYEVLGRLVEVVSGESFGGYASRQIFAPLGMGHTYADVAGANQDGLSSAFPLWFGMPQAHPQGAGFRADTVPAGYLMSSAADMSKYVVAQLNGGEYEGSRVVSAAGLDALHAPAVSAGLSAQGGSYAMGWFVGPQGGLKHTIWHNGSAAGMHSVVVMMPAEKWGVVLLTNSESALYEFLGRVEVIADNVVAMLTGLPMGGTLAGLYLAFDGVAAAIVALAVRKLVRLIRRAPRQRTGRFARTRNLFFNWVIPIWRELWVPVGIVVGFPLLTGAPWLGNLVTVDLGQWLLVLASLLFATGVTRVVLALRRRPLQPRPSAA